MRLSLLALSGHLNRAPECPLLGKKADINRRQSDVRFWTQSGHRRSGLHANSNAITFAQYRAGNLQNVMTVTESPWPVLASNALKSESQNTD